MKTIDDIELTRCPFRACRGEAYYYFNGEHVIACSKCGCRKSHRDDLPSLVAFWNNQSDSSLTLTMKLLIFSVICNAIVTFIWWPMYHEHAGTLPQLWEWWPL